MTVVEIPPGSGNRYKYVYEEGATVYKGPVGDSPQLTEGEFLERMVGGITIHDSLPLNLPSITDWPVVEDGLYAGMIVKLDETNFLEYKLVREGNGKWKAYQRNPLSSKSNTGLGQFSEVYQAKSGYANPETAWKRADEAYRLNRTFPAMQRELKERHGK